MIVYFRLCTEPPAPQLETVSSLCTSCGDVQRVVENGGEAKETAVPRIADKRGTNTGTFGSFSITAGTAVCFRCQNRQLARVSH